jgi:hypothetical protein
MASLQNRKPFSNFQIFQEIANSIEFKSNLDFERLSTREIKYKSTSSHNKICNNMNATNNYLFK